MLSFNLKIEALSYHPSVNDPNQYERSKLVILPSSVLEKLYEDLDTNISYPICFQIKSEKIIRNLYVSVLEFSSINDICYMPLTLMNEFWLSTDDEITLEYISPPLCSKIVLQPDKEEFFLLNNNKELLEEAVSKYYKILSINDIITFNVNNTEYQIYISNLEPNDVVITHETDIDLEYEESNEIKTKNRLQEIEIKKELDRIAEEHRLEEENKIKIRKKNEEEQLKKDEEIVNNNKFLKDLHEARMKRK